MTDSTHPTPPDLDEVLSKAKAATRGPWRLDGCKPEHTEDRNSSCYLVRTLTGAPVMGIDVNKEYIAAANPAAVIWMVERIRELEAQLHQHEGKYDTDGLLR